MSNAIEPGYVVPTPQPVKTIGLLSIIFGSILLLLGLISVASLALMPTWTRIMESQQARVQQQADEAADNRKKADLAGLAVREKAATTPDQREALARERQAIASRPRPFVPDTTMGMKMVNERYYMVYNIADSMTGVPLNIALIVAGVALMRMKRWARSLAMYVAGLKLLRLGVMLVYVVMVLAPNMTKSMAREFDKMGMQISVQQGGNAANAKKVQGMMRTMTQVMGASISGGYALYFVLATIFPIASLVVLNRPGARAALRDRKPAAVEGLSS